MADLSSLSHRNGSSCVEKPAPAGHAPKAVAGDAGDARDACVEAMRSPCGPSSQVAVLRRLRTRQLTLGETAMTNAARGMLSKTRPTRFAWLRRANPPKVGPPSMCHRRGGASAMLTAPGLISPGGDVQRGARRGTLAFIHEYAIRTSRRFRLSGRDIRRFGTVGRGRPIKVKTADLRMAQGVLHKDTVLEHESYLTELLSQRERRSVLLPSSRTRHSWDTMIALLVSYTSIMLPIQLCYDNVPLTLPPELIIFDVVTDLIFLVDICLNFHTGYIEDARVIVDQKRIRQRYLSRWFVIDAIGSFPGDSIFFFLSLASASSDVHQTNGSKGPSDDRISEQQASLLTLFKILKVPKLMRLGRLFKTLEKIEGAANVGSIIILVG